jgi:uncharacterized protein (AIM24 family)
MKQRLEGDGLCFVHASGNIQPFKLKPAETRRVATGTLVALQSSEFVGGLGDLIDGR